MQQLQQHSIELVRGLMQHSISEVHFGRNEELVDPGIITTADDVAVIVYILKGVHNLLGIQYHSHSSFSS